MTSTRKRVAAKAGSHERTGKIKVCHPACGVEGCEKPSDVAMFGEKNKKTLMVCRDHIYDAMMKVMDRGPVRITLWTRLFHPEDTTPRERPAMDAAVALAARGMGIAVLRSPAGASRTRRPVTRAGRKKRPR